MPVGDSSVCGEDHHAKKGSCSKSKHLPHRLYCDRCDISILCPKKVGDHKENGEDEKEVAVDGEIIMKQEGGDSP